MDKKLLYALVSVVGLAAVLYSCMREDFGDWGGSGKTGMLTIADARRHFEQAYSSTKSGSDPATTPVLTPGDFTPSWGNSTTTFDGLSCVNTPILPEYSYEAIWHLPDRDHKVKVFQKYITVREVGSTLTDSYILTLVPCGMFPRGVGDLGDRFQYCGDRANYTGIALYYHQGFSYPFLIEVYVDGRVKRAIGLDVTDSSEVFYDKLRKMSSMMSGITFRRYKVPPIGTRFTIDEHDREKWDDEEDFEEDIEDPITGDDEPGGESDDSDSDNPGSDGQGGGPGNGSDGGSGTGGGGGPGGSAPGSGTNGNGGTNSDYDQFNVDPDRIVRLVYVIDHMPGGSNDDGSAILSYLEPGSYTGGSGGGTNTGGGGGGGWGGTSSVYVRPRYLNPNADIAELLDELMNELRRHNTCMGRALTNKLYSCHDLKIEKAPYDYCQNDYVAGHNLIRLHPLSGSADLSHELFHHVQAEPYKRYDGDPNHIVENAENIQAYGNRGLNFEVEAWIMMYRYADEAPVSKISGVSYKQWKTHEITEACKEASMLLDNKGNLRPGVSEQDFSKAFNNVADKLVERFPDTYGTLKYEENSSSSENLSTLRDISKEC